MREKVLEIGHEGGGFELLAEFEGGVPARFFVESGGRSAFGGELDEPRAGHGPLTWEQVLLGPDGKKYASATPGTLGGNGKQRVYVKLTCGSARSAIRRWGEAYTRTRVFFADEATAIAAGYRPCGNCMRGAYAEWRKRQTGPAA
jgi:hypothetical protein